MRSKFTIQKYDEDRVLVYDSKGLSNGAVKIINSIAMSKGYTDMMFATLDDDRIGVVCKPQHWVNVMRWFREKMGFPHNQTLEKHFLRMAHEAMKSEQTQQYKEELTKKEEETAKELEETIHEVREENAKMGIDDQREADDKIWDKDKL